MFTGIIQAVGTLSEREARGTDMRVHVATADLALDDVHIGDSIAVSGVCLTAVTLSDVGFWADVSGETLARTALGAVPVGGRVNLEKALTLATPLGGHLVSGHVDGMGEVLERRPDGRSQRFRIQAPERLARYIAEKGSVCIDGISLTVNAVNGRAFDINIVPHTLESTTMGEFRAGRKVNLEVDLIARYVERLMLGSDAARDGEGLTQDFLARYGFIKGR